MGAATLRGVRPPSRIPGKVKSEAWPLAVRRPDRFRNYLSYWQPKERCKPPVAEVGNDKSDASSRMFIQSAGPACTKYLSA